MFRKRFNWNQNGSNSVQLWCDEEGYIKVPQVRQVVGENIFKTLCLFLSGKGRKVNVDFVES